MEITKIARVCYEVIRAYCQAMGDFTRPNWEHAEDWLKAFVIREVQFFIDNPKALPSAFHETWLKEKTAEGWKYGAVEDVVLKEHPYCVPYWGLSKEHRVKDFIFEAIVRELLKVTAEQEKSEGKNG